MENKIIFQNFKPFFSEFEYQTKLLSLNFHFCGGGGGCGVGGGGRVILMFLK